MKNPFRKRTAKSLQEQEKQKLIKPQIKKKSRNMKKILSNLVKKSKKIKKNYELRRRNIEKSGKDTDYLITKLENIDVKLDNFEELLSNYKTQKNFYQKMMKKNDYQSFSGHSVTNDEYQNNISNDVKKVREKQEGYYDGKEDKIKKKFCERILVCVNLCRYLCKMDKLWNDLPLTPDHKKTIKKHRSPKYIPSNQNLLDEVWEAERLTKRQGSEIAGELFKLFDPNYFSLGKPHKKLSKYLAQKDFANAQDFVNKVVINAIGSIPGVKFNAINKYCNKYNCNRYAVKKTSKLRAELLTRKTLAHTIYSLKNIFLDV